MSTRRTTRSSAKQASASVTAPVRTTAKRKEISSDEAEVDDRAPPAERTKTKELEKRDFLGGLPIIDEEDDQTKPRRGKKVAPKTSSAAPKKVGAAKAASAAAPRGAKVTGSISTSSGKQENCTRCGVKFDPAERIKRRKVASSIMTTFGMRVGTMKAIHFGSAVNRMTRVSRAARSTSTHQIQTPRKAEPLE